MEEHQYTLPIRSKNSPFDPEIYPTADSSEGQRKERDKRKDNDKDQTGSLRCEPGTSSKGITDQCSDDEEHLDLFSSFGFTPRHFLRKAVSTTFKTFSDTIKSKTQFIYNNGLGEGLLNAAGTDEPSTFGRQPRTLHRMSNSVSRSGARFISSLKGRHSRGGNKPSFTVDADAEGDQPSINVVIPNSAFSSLNVEYPWLRPSIQEPRQNVKSAGQNIPGQPSSARASPESGSDETPRASPRVPLGKSSRALALRCNIRQLNTNSNAPDNTQLEEQANMDQEDRQDAKPPNSSLKHDSYDADIESGELAEHKSQGIATMGSKAEWIRRREDRQRRYETVCLVSSAQSSVDIQFTVTTNPIDTEAEDLNDDSLTEHSPEEPICPSNAELSSDTRVLYAEPYQSEPSLPYNMSTFVSIGPVWRDQRFPQYAVDAIERRNGDDLDYSTDETSPSLRAEAVTEDFSEAEMPSIDGALTRTALPILSPPRVGRNRRPELNRHVSALSAESADDCALTSKSQLRVRNMERSTDHRRRASSDKDLAAKEKVRWSLSNVTESEKDFVVDHPSHRQSPISGSSEYDSDGLPTCGYSQKLEDLYGGKPDRLCQADLEAYGFDKHLFRGSKAVYRGSSSTSEASSAAGTDHSPTAMRRRSRVSFKLPEDYSPSGKSSKHYRRPSPCPILSMPSTSRIPAPTFESPTASGRKTVSLVSLPREASKDTSTTNESAVNEIAARRESVTSRLPMRSAFVHGAPGGSEETEFMTATEGEGESPQEEEMESPLGDTRSSSPYDTVSYSFLACIPKVQHSSCEGPQYSIDRRTDSGSPSTCSNTVYHATAETSKHEAGAGHKKSENDHANNASKLPFTPQSGCALPFTHDSHPGSHGKPFSKPQGSLEAQYGSYEDGKPQPRYSLPYEDQPFKPMEDVAETADVPRQTGELEMETDADVEATSPPPAAKGEPAHEVKETVQSKEKKRMPSGRSSAPTPIAATLTSEPEPEPKSHLAPAETSPASGQTTPNKRVSGIVFYGSSPRTRTKWNPIKARRSLNF